LKSDQVL